MCVTREHKPRFDLLTAHKLGAVDVRYSPESFDQTVKCYHRYLKKRFKWFRRILWTGATLVGLGMLIQWQTDLLAGTFRWAVIPLIVIFASAMAISIVIRRRLTIFKRKSAAVTFGEPARYVFYQEGIAFCESYQQGTLRWNDFYDIGYEKDFLWLLLHSPDYGGESTREYADIIIPASVVNADPALEAFFREGGPYSAFMDEFYIRRGADPRQEIRKEKGDVMDRSQDLRAALLNVISRQDSDGLDSAIEPLLRAGEPHRYQDLFQQLLVLPGHHHHQEVAMELQQTGDPSTISYVRQVFAQGFDYLDYTCSDSDAIAKWFSHLLWKIGTPEALALIEEYAEHPDEGIREEMRYRLKRIAESQPR